VVAFGGGGVLFGSILIVCTGNICRSPMAMALLRDRLGKRGAHVEVDSAGIAALVGHPADPEACDLMSTRGLDISDHRARQLTPDLVRARELILVMEAAQQREVEGALPMARGRVHRLGRWGEFDVPDPYQRGRPAFERALALIERGLDDFERAFRS
jgi:protein-tyrosine phosphatase